MSNPQWVNIAADRLVVFPANALLRMSEESLEPLGLKPFSEDEFLLFGLSARMAKDGRSLSISIPLPNKGLFPQLISYFHRVRMDTLSGHIFGSYYQIDQLWDRNDLIWFGRPPQILENLRKIPGVSPCRITAKTIKNHETFVGGKKFARTPLVPTTFDLSETFDMLAEKTQPFTFIIDATPSGVRDKVKEIWDGVSIWFPDVPIIIISALGDLQTDKTLDRIPVNRWIHRMPDQSTWLQRNSTEKPGTSVKYTFLEIPDNFLSTQLAETYPKVFNLKKQIANEEKVIQQQSYSKAQKVLQLLSTLSCPLSIREQVLVRHTKGGLYGTRTISRELEIMSGVTLRHGDSQNNCNAIQADLVSIYKLIGSGETGKSQMLLKMVKDSILVGKSLLLLVSNKPEEDALIEYIHNQGICIVDNKMISVKSTGQLKSILSLSSQFDRCLVLTKIWDNDFWWLAGVAKHIYWPCYPFEIEACQKRFKLWGQKVLVPSSSNGDKLSLLKFAWPKDHCVTDIKVEDEGFAVNTLKLSQCCGSYPQSMTVNIDQKRKPITWLIEILEAEEKIPEEGDFFDIGNSTVDCARITVEGLLNNISWPLSRLIYVIDNDPSGYGVIRKKVNELKEGDLIILRQSGAAHEELLSSLFDELHSNTDFEEVRRWSGFWDTIVDGAANKFNTPRKLLSALKKLGTNVDLATVQNWLNGKVWGPQDQLSVKNMAIAAGNQMLAGEAPKIHKAIKRIWTEHQQIGKDLSRALLSRAKGATTVTVGSMTLDVDLLDEILKIYTVHSIDMPGDTPIYPKTLADLIPYIQEHLSEGLLLTSKAIRSMQKSPYRDLKKAASCFELMSTLMTRFYKKEIRRETLIDAFRELNVDIKSGTSQITQGVCSGYDVKYEGQTVDIGAHLCLGTARDPSKTMRIHYHWDDNKSLVVVHHAGRHLPTRNE